MSSHAGPKIDRTGLIYQLDAANLKNSGLSNVEVLVVAGGGGGGYRHGAGGGGGGVIYNSLQSTTSEASYIITVGAGGVGGTGGHPNGYNGENSSAFGLTAIGGGAGGSFDSTGIGAVGGSGGGSCTGNKSSGTAGQGYAGGSGYTAMGSPYNWGGGGGAGGIGSDGSASSCGDGGIGVFMPSFIFAGQNGYFGGGGGGGSHDPIPTDGSPGRGGLGGGGDSGQPGVVSQPGVNGLSNTGGGGGGAATSSGGTGVGGAGGSGVVIIRYNGSQRATGGTITTVGNDTVHTFTSSGTFTPLMSYQELLLTSTSIFNNQSLDGATALTKTVSNNELTITAGYTAWINAAYNFKTYKNFEITGEFNTNADHCGITFGTPNLNAQSDGYAWCIRLNWSSNVYDNRLQKWLTGAQTYLAPTPGSSAGQTLPQQFARDTWHRFKIQVFDKVFKSWINDWPCLQHTITDSSFDVGYLGFGSVGTTKFRNIKISSDPAGLPDLSENNYFSVLGNNPSITKENNGAAVFNGSNDYISIPFTPTRTSPYTILLWAKPSQLLINGNVPPGTVPAPSGANRRTLIVGPGPNWNPGIWVTKDCLRSHCNTEYRDNLIDWDDLSWHQIGQVFDGTNTYNIWDGQILSSGYRTAYSPGAQTSLLLGAESTGGGATNWIGAINNVQIFTRALSAAEIKQSYFSFASRYLN